MKIELNKEEAEALYWAVSHWEEYNTDMTQKERDILIKYIDKFAEIWGEDDARSDR